MVIHYYSILVVPILLLDVWQGLNLWRGLAQSAREVLGLGW
jgi:hypothetical protein